MNAQLIRTTAGYKIDICEKDSLVTSIKFDIESSEIKDPWLEARVCLDCLDDASNISEVSDLTGEYKNRGYMKHSRIDV